MKLPVTWSFIRANPSLGNVCRREKPRQPLKACGFLLVLSVSQFDQVWASSDDPTCGCLDPAYPNQGDVFAIDARNGKKVKGSDQYAAGTDVAIILDNQNPFIANYILNHAAEDAESKVLANAIDALFGFEDAKSADAAEEVKKADEEVRTAFRASRCPASIKLSEAIETLGQAQDAAKSVSMLKSASAGALFSSENDCVQMCSASHAVYANKASLDESTKNVAAAINDFKANWQGWLRDQKCPADPSALNTQKDFVVAALEASIKELAPLNTLIADVGHKLDQRRPFTTIVRPGSSTGATLHTVTVERKSADGFLKSEDKWTHTYMTGYSRFSYSVGIGISTIEQNAYEVGTTNVGSGGGDQENVVRVSDSTRERIGIVGQVNGELARWSNPWLINDPISLMWSVGASISNGSDDVNFGFYTGPTLGFIDNRLLVTAGYHVLSVEEPDPGFEEGATLPSDFSGDVPTRNETDTGLLLTFTWRFQ